MKREPIPTTCEKCEYNWQARTFVNQQAARVPKSEAAKQASRENGKKGGRPCGSKNGNSRQRKTKANSGDDVCLWHSLANQRRNREADPSDQGKRRRILENQRI